MIQEEIIDIMKRSIARHFNVSPKLIYSKHNSFPAPLMRYIFSYQLLKHFDLPIVAIAKIVFPSADHALVFKGLLSLRKQVRSRATIKNLVNSITEEINEQLKEREVAS